MIAPTEFDAPVIAAPRARSDSFAARLLRHRLAQVGIFIIAALIFVAIFAPQISHIDPRATLPNALNSLGSPHAPDGKFLLGADTLGRDVWTRALYGTRVSLIVALCAMFTATIIGTTIGLLSGYFGGWVDIVLMRFTEIVLSLPTILLAIALASVLPDDPILLPNGDSFDRKLLNLLLAIALVTWTGIRAGGGRGRDLRGAVWAGVIGNSGSRFWSPGPRDWDNPTAAHPASHDDAPRRNPAPGGLSGSNQQLPDHAPHRVPP